MAYVKSRHPDAKDARQYLHPRYVAEFLGYGYEERPNLDLELQAVGGTASRRTGSFVGQLDRERRLIFVSETQPPDERRFTGLHEIGHLILHGDLEVVHRDRPASATVRRQPRERQADEFAAAYGMPAAWLRLDIKERFGTPPVMIDDNLAWWLDPNDPHRFQHAGLDRLDAEFHMARCTRTSYGEFVALKDAYCVTATAMALRLNELDAVYRTRGFGIAG